MLESTAEAVTGRHGLVSNGFLLWKVGVKNVYNYTEKLVEFHPHNPQRRFGKTLSPNVIPRARQLYPDNTPPNTTSLYTVKNTKTPDRAGQLYPVSTEPITTITTYIIRGGTSA